jgi:hypothetical protein
MAKNKKGLTEDMSIEQMAEAIIEHTGLEMADLQSYMADETMMRTFHEQAMQGDPVPSNFEERKPEPPPVLDSKGKKVKGKSPAAKAKKAKAKAPVKEAGFIDLESGRRVNLGHVVCDKTDQGYNRGRNNIIVPTPDYLDQMTNLVFEMWAEITEEFPVAIIEDIRLRAHALFTTIQVQKGPKTAGKFKTVVVNRTGYTILSPTVSDSEVKKMKEYLLNEVNEDEEMDKLAAKMLG